MSEPVKPGRKLVNVRFSMVMPVDVPEDWDNDSVEFWLNDSSSCMDNHLHQLLAEVKRHLGVHGCSCWLITGKVE